MRREVERIGQLSNQLVALLYRFERMYKFFSTTRAIVYDL